MNHFDHGKPDFAELRVRYEDGTVTSHQIKPSDINIDYIAHRMTVWIPGEPEHTAAKQVIYNPPATIAIWPDGSKTVVKCDERDTYDPKLGLALCYMKKMMGSSRAFNDALRAGKAEEEADKTDRGRAFAKRMVSEEKVLPYALQAGTCPIDANCHFGCPYARLEYKECVAKLTKDVKAVMKDGEKHD